jgi:hypothetical protein
MEGKLGKSSWIRYFRSPLMAQGPRETRQFYLWRMTLLAYAYPQALYPLYAPLWATVLAPDVWPEPIPLSLIAALRTPQISRSGLPTPLARIGDYPGSHLIAGTLLLPDEAGYAALERADIYVYRHYLAYVAEIAGEMNKAPDPNALLEILLARLAEPLASVSLLTPDTLEAAQLLYRVLTLCVEPGTREQIGDETTMAGSTAPTEGTLYLCLSQLDFMASQCADAQASSRGTFIRTATDTYATVLGRPQELTRAMIDELRDELDMSVYTLLPPIIFDVRPATLALDYVFSVFFDWATRGVFVPTLGGYSKAMLLASMQKLRGAPLPPSTRKTPMRKNEDARNLAKKITNWHTSVAKYLSLKDAPNIDPKEIKTIKRAHDKAVANLLANGQDPTAPAAAAAPKGRRPAREAAIERRHAAPPLRAAAPPIADESPARAAEASPEQGRNLVAEAARPAYRMVQGANDLYFLIDATDQPVYDDNGILVQPVVSDYDVDRDLCGLRNLQWWQVDYFGNPHTMQPTPPAEQEPGEPDVVSAFGPAPDKQSARIGADMHALTMALAQCGLCA